ncbi:MAG: serine/threonine protein kinase, partial [Alphaproteobacteria bacterium]|nr:serine/threonine protein kinase [Alphaproteobacteria bacterium]
MVDMRSETTAADPEVDFVALPVGAQIGRYEVLSVLGQGGFGITYRARDVQLDREVAIKEYLPTALAVRQNGITVMPRSTKVAEDFTWGRDRFVAEGRVMATLHRAPGIVRVFDFLEINGTAYIVMEMLHGDTLEGHIKKHGPLDAPAIDRILWPLLDGLEQVHNAGFLHRDIKPANILLDAAGNPTLIDFGASRAAMVGRTVAMTAIFTPGRADDVGQAGAVDRHLRPLGDALPRHHRQGAAQCLRPHARRRVRAAGKDCAAGICARADRRHRCRLGRARVRPAAIHCRLAHGSVDSVDGLARRWSGHDRLAHADHPAGAANGIAGTGNAAARRRYRNNSDATRQEPHATLCR